MSATITVPAIEHGTVIDHISHGQALAILELLQLGERTVTLALNLPSNSMGKKDLIKVEGLALSKDEVSQIALLSSRATVNIVENYEVAKKYTVEPPKEVRKFLTCPNRRCITHVEPVESRFAVKKGKRALTLTCHFCEQSFNQQL